MMNRQEPSLQRGSQPAGKECTRGVAVGTANGLAMAVLAGAPPLIALLAAAGGGALGALIALLIWAGSDGLHEDPVVPPRDKRRG